MTWLIRNAVRDDAEILAEIERAAFGPASWGAASVKESLNAPYVTSLLAARPGGAPEAFALWRRLGEEGEILSLGVVPQARRQGAARMLLDRIAGDARAQRVVALFLEVDAGNLAAQSLYRSQGFMLVGERRSYYRNGADAQVLKKAL